jgi:purine-binding chemotaxis protein CheW
VKVVIFNLADKEYAVDINDVREVIRLRKIVSVPDAAEFVEGVISLRGKVVTLINLRKKMGFAAELLNKSARIIITEINSRPLGIIVDNVSAVTDLQKENITIPDEALAQAKYLTGIAKINKRIILVVDIRQLLSSEDKAGIESVFKKVELRKKE